MIWARWFPPRANDYAGILHPCNRSADLGEVNDAELDRLDEEIRKEFEETRQSATDFGKGIVVGLLRNAGELPFNIAGAILNSSEIQDMPDNMEAPGIENKTAYQCGKITADALTTALGIAEVILGVGEIATGIAGDVGGGALCATVVGAPAGIAAIAGSTALVVSGAAEVGAGITLAVSGGKKLGGDFDEFKKANQEDAKDVSKNSVDKWNKGTFDSVEDSLRYHFEKHGEEVGATDIDQYVRKAEGFAQNLRGATKSYPNMGTPGAIRYEKNGKYIILSQDGTIISYGLAR